MCFQSSLTSSGFPSVGRIQRFWIKFSRGHQPSQRLEHWIYRESLRVLSLCSLRKIQHRTDITFYKCPVRGDREDRARHFSEVHSNRTRRNRHKLEHGNSE